MSRRETEKVRLTVRVEKALLKRLKAKAAEEGRSVQWYINRFIAQFFDEEPEQRKKGYAWKRRVLNETAGQLVP